MEKQNVGWKKNLAVEKKMSVGEFPLAKTDMSGMSGIPCNARPKNGRGGKKRPRAYRGGKKKKSSSFGKTKCWLEKKFPVMQDRKMAPVMQDRKTAEAGKNPLGPIGRNKKVENFFLSLGRKKCQLEKKMSAVQNDRA